MRCSWPISKRRRLLNLSSRPELEESITEINFSTSSFELMIAEKSLFSFSRSSDSRAPVFSRS
ncbi:MAG: hypothetical protein A2W80_08860 [Candidatus Riflebacteria bacterium GWC2_50_8]|nr:MAG: hypothetical protein A2W80_08860 [Candidatus Riflebacteria bacterium GWC2_50_8]